MALAQVDFFSEFLKQQYCMNVILPEQINGYSAVSKKRIEPPYPVLYLLHGTSQNHTDWTRFCALERYAQRTGLVIVMAATLRGWYTNQKIGYPFFDFFTKKTGVSDLDAGLKKLNWSLNLLRIDFYSRIQKDYLPLKRLFTRPLIFSFSYFYQRYPALTTLFRLGEIAPLLRAAWRQHFLEPVDELKQSAERLTKCRRFHPTRRQR